MRKIHIHDKYGIYRTDAAHFPGGGGRDDMIEGGDGIDGTEGVGGG